MNWFIALAASAAAVDWLAVHRRNRRVEYVAKPAVMVALALAASAADVDPAVIGTWFLAAVLLSLAGDVFLMLRQEQFVAGLASFLLAHVAYTGGLWSAGITGPAFTIGLGLAAVAIGSVGHRIGSAVRRNHPGLTGPVWAYIIAISTMLATAIGTGNTLAIAGAVFFYVSDAVLGWTRFVAPVRHGRLAVIVPYHVGQMLLVAALPTF